MSREVLLNMLRISQDKSADRVPPKALAVAQVIVGEDATAVTVPMVTKLANCGARANCVIRVCPTGK